LFDLIQLNAHLAIGAASNAVSQEAPVGFINVFLNLVIVTVPLESEINKEARTEM
jgi:hypothetical protein